MAIRPQSNKIRRLKKKKLQKKRRQTGKKHKRLHQGKKQRKHQAARAGTRPVLSISSPRIFATKILRLMPKVRMETKARGLMKTLLMDVYDRVSKEVQSRSQNNQLATVDPAEVQAVFKEAMARQLAKHSTEHSGGETLLGPVASPDETLLGPGASPETATA